LRDPETAKKLRNFMRENFKGMDAHVQTSMGVPIRPTFEMLTNDQLCKLYMHHAFGLRNLRMSNLQKLCEITPLVPDLIDVIEDSLRGASLSIRRPVIKDNEGVVDVTDIPQKLLGVKNTEAMLRIVRNIPAADMRRFKRDISLDVPIPVVVLKGRGVTSQDERNRAAAYWYEPEDAPYVQFRLV